MEKRKLTKEDLDKVRNIEGFPIGKDEDIIALSDPPYYTACPKRLTTKPRTIIIGNRLPVM